MLEQAQDVVSSTEFIPLPEAALALRVSPRKLKNLLARRGLPLFMFGRNPEGEGGTPAAADTQRPGSGQSMKTDASA